MFIVALKPSGYIIRYNYKYAGNVSGDVYPDYIRYQFGADRLSVQVF
jgi:hypothetical protein